MNDNPYSMPNFIVLTQVRKVLSEVTPATRISTEDKVNSIQNYPGYCDATAASPDEVADTLREDILRTILLLEAG